MVSSSSSAADAAIVTNAASADATAVAHAVVAHAAVSMGLARPSSTPPTPQVSSPVDVNKSAAETSGLTDVLGNLSASSNANLATVFSPTVLVGDESDSDD